MTILIDPVERDIARHADWLGQLDEADEKWGVAKTKLITCLVNGGSIHMRGQLFYDQEDMAWEGLQTEATKEAFDRASTDKICAGFHMGRARRMAALKLVEQVESSFRDAFERGQLNWSGDDE